MPFYKLLAITALVATATACSTSPRGNERVTLIPEDQMQAMGNKAFAQMKSKMQTVNGEPQEFVQCVVNHLTPHVKKGDAPKNYTVEVFKKDQANAFALPGGHIGVFTGMLDVANTQSQLAAVLAHEIGHLIANHANARASQKMLTQGGLALLQKTLDTGEGENYNLLMGALGLGAQYGVIMPHTREQEKEADILGLKLMARAGFDPTAAVELWQEMQKRSKGQAMPAWLSTHPPTDTRIDYLKSHLDEARAINDSGEDPDCELSSQS